MIFVLLLCIQVKIMSVMLGVVYMNPDWVSIRIELIPLLLRS